ncbi:uncharacterized protein [Ambystoma mexicanum]|uniref:uncharacterized protein n=1 Tax=Ambystoma mexicanum TaxID=8296 RepID=UPI0037E8DD6E
MGLADWLTTLFSHRRVTDSQISILTESQPLTNMAPHCNVVLRSARPVVDQGEGLGTLRGLEVEFSRLVTCVGGKEKFLFVGDAAATGKTSGCGIFQELSRCLFGNANGEAAGTLGPEEKGKSNTSEEKAQKGAVEVTAAKSRAFMYPAILVVFKLAILKETANKVTIREILKDVSARAKEASPVVIGIVYCEEEVSEEEEQACSRRLLRYLEEAFHPESGRGPRVGVCLYAKFRPKSILGVRGCVWEMLRDTVAGYQQMSPESRNWSDLDKDPQKAFCDLITQVGGKESFLLVGMLCPSVETADKVKLFQEVAHDLFDDQRNFADGSTCRRSTKDDNNSLDEPNTVAPAGALKPCTQLEKPQTFPFPVILVVFKLQFVKDKTSRVLIKEILRDIRGRCKGVAPAIVGILYSEEQTSEEHEQTSLSRLSRCLKETFHLNPGRGLAPPANVCFYVQSQPESILGVKRCICGVLRCRGAQ